MTLNLYGKQNPEPEQNPERSWWWIGPIILIAGLLIWLCGCATVKVKDGDFELEAATLLKDVRTDPNGVLSTVSPQSPGIIEAAAGFIAGFAVFGL